jgi:hypothetical protein
MVFGILKGWAESMAQERKNAMRMKQGFFGFICASMAENHSFNCKG